MKYLRAHACVPQGEAKRYLAALKKTALQQGDAMLSVATMYSIADGIDLQTELQPVIELLNDACAPTYYHAWPSGHNT